MCAHYHQTIHQERHTDKVHRNDWAKPIVIQDANGHFTKKFATMHIVSDNRVKTVYPAQSTPQAVDVGMRPPNQNYKTELCRNYGTSKGCLYGIKCNFAHGEEELMKFSNAHEMQVESPDNYMCLPCFDHVATGACPYGSRCHSLHDPRVSGSEQAWLDCYTKPKRKDLNIIPDPLYYHRSISPFQMNPIVDYRAWKLFGDNSDPFQATYEIVCNINIPVFGTPNPSLHHSTKLSGAHKLCIVRAMMLNSTCDFVYTNKHYLNTQPCLVLQTRYFRLNPLMTNAVIAIEDLVQEVSDVEYNSHCPMMIHADEIVFESKGKRNCNRSIWFDAKISDFGGRIDNVKVENDNNALFCMLDMNKSFEMNPNHNAITPYVMMQSKDDLQDGRNLIDAIIKHRIWSILAAHGVTCDFHELKADFLRLQKTTNTWMWPKLDGVQISKIFEQTREEHNNNAYSPHVDREDNMLMFMWGTFVGKKNANKPCLGVFHSLRNSKSVNLGKKLPHITGSPTKFVSCHPVDTWKELILGKDGPYNRARNDFESGSGTTIRSSSS